ncbi:MAG: hypothetical protein Q8M16_19710 [Pirellulaceae bacterium]|nr:hypothetical protein [Pirellulaceae bacterium]
MTSGEESNSDEIKHRWLEWRLLRLWLIIPGLWLGVWLLAVGLFAWENAISNSAEVARLGWLPTLIASLATSLYLASRTRLLEAVGSWQVNGAACVIAALFVGTQICLGGWLNGFVASLVLAVGEIQRLLAFGPASASSATHPETEARDIRLSTDSHSQVTPPAEPRSVPTPFSESQSIQSLVSVDSSEAGPNDPESLGVGLGHLSAIPDDPESDEDPEASIGDWVQQMTRSPYESPCHAPSPDDNETEDKPSFERVEWFCRHRWRPTEVQVDLHFVFQPAFSGKPRLSAEVVEGTGLVSIGDIQAHGTRLQLKRQSSSGADDYAVVWLEAIGPV